MRCTNSPLHGSTAGRDSRAPSSLCPRRCHPPQPFFISVSMPWSSSSSCTAAARRLDRGSTYHNSCICEEDTSDGVEPSAASCDVQHAMSVTFAISKEYCAAIYPLGTQVRMPKLCTEGRRARGNRGTDCGHPLAHREARVGATRSRAL